MSDKVIITKSLLDDLADALGDTVGINVPATLSSMTSQVEAIPRRESLSVSNNAVTALSGFYPNSVTTTISAKTAFAPTVTLASSTGVITGTNTFTSGYYAASTTTSTLNLTTKAAATYNTSTADQTVASNRWLTGTQTIKSVTTANISAANIVSGVTVKVGDANNASRILQVTGTAPTGTVQTAFAPAVTLASSTGVITGTNTFAAGVYAASTKTSTLNLTTEAAATYNTSTADQTVASYRWLTGAQTIKSVTTSNLTAANIKSGVVVKVGDANNASRIKQVTGTYDPAPTYTATINGTGNSGYCYVQLNSGTKYYTAGDTFTFKAGDSLYCYTYYSGGVAQLIEVNGSTVQSGTTSANYTYTMPGKDIKIALKYSGQGSISINESVAPDVYKAAYTYTPRTYSQTITSGTYLAGSQTILGDSNLIASNIKSGVSIFGVNGTHQGQTYTATITKAGDHDGGHAVVASEVIYNGTNYWQLGSFEFEPGATLSCVVMEYDSSTIGYVYVNGEIAHEGAGTFVYYYTLPARDITIELRTPSEGITIKEEFYDIYKLIAYKSVISSSAANVSTWINSLSILTSGQFAQQPLQGDFVFSNVSKVSYYAFGFANDFYASPAGATYTLEFPLATSMDTAAFYNNPWLTSINMPNITKIDVDTFVRCSRLTTISFPNCTYIGDSAFYSCSNSGFTTLSFSKCVSIGAWAFAYCSKVTDVYLPVCNSIKWDAFHYCRSLASIDLPALSAVDNSVFCSCRWLANVNLPSCTTIAANAFYTCSSLTSISLPKCTSIGQLAFYSCTALVSIYLPGGMSSWGNSAFAYCSSLQTVSIPNCVMLSGNYTFDHCVQLVSLYLNSVSSVPVLGYQTFSSTPIGGYSTSAGRYGSVFVPSSLYNSFITATNWAAISSRIVSV